MNPDRINTAISTIERDTIGPHQRPTGSARLQFAIFLGDSPIQAFADRGHITFGLPNTRLYKF